MIAYLMASKEILALSAHFIYDPFFNIKVMCFTNSEKFGIKLLTKLVLPRKD